MCGFARSNRPTARHPQRTERLESWRCWSAEQHRTTTCHAAVWSQLRTVAPQCARGKNFMHLLRALRELPGALNVVTTIKQTRTHAHAHTHKWGPTRLCSRTATWSVRRRLRASSIHGRLCAHHAIHGCARACARRGAVHGCRVLCAIRGRKAASHGGHATCTQWSSAMDKRAQGGVCIAL